MRKIMIFVVMVVMLLQLVSAQLVDEPYGDVKERSILDLFQFGSFSITSSVQEPPGWSCNSFTAEKTFNAADRKAINVGSVCNSNSKVVLWRKIGSNFVREGISYKINGVNPRFVGFYYGNNYKYKCYSCSGTSNTNPNTGDSQKINTDGYCLTFTPTSTTYRCAKTSPSDCDKSLDSVNDKTVGYYNSKSTCDTELKKLTSANVRYGITCSGQTCRCISSTTGDYSTKSTCDFYASEQTKERNKQLESEKFGFDKLGYCLITTTSGKKTCLSSYKSNCGSSFFEGQDAGTKCFTERNKLNDEVAEKTRFDLTCTTNSCYCYEASVGPYSLKSQCDYFAALKDGRIKKEITKSNPTIEQEKQAEQILKDEEELSIEQQEELQDIINSAPEFSDNQIVGFSSNSEKKFFDFKNDPVTAYSLVGLLILIAIVIGFIMFKGKLKF